MITTDSNQISADPLLHQEITYKIRGAIFNVYNTLGFGHKEAIYHKSLAIELKKTGLSFSDEQSLDVMYGEEVVGKYKPDFVVENAVIIELKAVPFTPKEAETQIVYYLKGTGYNVGLLVNFGSSKLEIKRKVWTNQRKSAEISAKI
jgi:GxxExxY protein